MISMSKGTIMLKLYVMHLHSNCACDHFSRAPYMVHLLVMQLQLRLCALLHCAMAVGVDV